MATWTYHTSGDLDRTLVDRLTGFPREPDMLVYGLRLAAASLVRGWLRLYHRLRIVGRDHLPTTGSFVIVANHASHLDAPVILSALPLSKVHNAFPAAARDYFFSNVSRAALSATLVNAVPFDREHHLRQSINLCRELLNDPGNVLVVFPEGTRSTTGQIDEFKPGIGLVLAGTQVPVVPCYVDGTYESLPKGRWLPAARQVTLTIGAPRTYSTFRPGKASALHICQELRQSVADLASPGRGPACAA
jgi:1-acyl-sn-glycerol-3-phosphate acyltransferase